MYVEIVLAGQFEGRWKHSNGLSEMFFWIAHHPMFNPIMMDKLQVMTSNGIKHEITSVVGYCEWDYWEGFRHSPPHPWIQFLDGKVFSTVISSKSQIFIALLIIAVKNGESWSYMGFGSISLLVFKDQLLKRSRRCELFFSWFSVSDTLSWRECPNVLGPAWCLSLYLPGTPIRFSLVFLYRCHCRSLSQCPF